MSMQEFKNCPAVPVGVAAVWLSVSPKRVYQLLSSGRLERLRGCGFVTVASIERRRRNSSQSGK
jgi:hypothetical protein